MLTFAALDPGDTFTKAELASATRALPAEGVRNAAQALVRALEGAGVQRADYWTNRVLPYLRLIWPKASINALFQPECGAPLATTNLNGALHKGRRS